jgi:hypothetical protein
VELGLLLLNDIGSVWCEYSCICDEQNERIFFFFGRSYYSEMAVVFLKLEN